MTWYVVVEYCLTEGCEIWTQFLGKYETEDIREAVARAMKDAETDAKQYAGKRGLAVHEFRRVIATRSLERACEEVDYDSPLCDGWAS